MQTAKTNFQAMLRATQNTTLLATIESSAGAMTMRHSGKVVQQQSMTWPYGLERWGHDPVEKRICQACVRCAARKEDACCTVSKTMHRAEREKRNQQECSVTNSSEF